jgi:hypothetical protein
MYDKQRGIRWFVCIERVIIVFSVSYCAGMARHLAPDERC